MTAPVAATLYDWLLFLHLLGAMVWFGGAVAVSLLAGRVLRGGDAEAIRRFIGNLRLIGPALFLPAMLAVIGFGIWMVSDSDAWSFSQTWVSVGFWLFVAAFLVGAGFQSRAAIAAQRAVDAGEVAEAAKQFGRWVWGMRVILLLLVVATWDMVMKPGL
jgi:uncharacterized membrane protein